LILIHFADVSAVPMFSDDPFEILFTDHPKEIDSIMVNVIGKQ
jgi:hypothetical protein